jgi:[ribosomal protein S5]-alanine N-acetyltransferase
MLHGNQIRLRRIEKADLWRLWEWHEKEDLYLFNSIRPFVTWSEIHDGFEKYFSWKADLIVETVDNSMLGICSYHNIVWKNRACLLSFQFLKEYCTLNFSVQAVQILTSFIFNELNLIRVDSYVQQKSDFTIQTLKKNNFKQEGLLREHFFKNNQYFDIYIFSKSRKAINNDYWKSC